MARLGTSGRHGVPLSWLIVVGLLLAACAPAAPPARREQPSAAQPEQPAGWGTVRIAYPNDLEAANPYANSTSNIHARFLHVADALIWQDAQGNLVPRLAQSWSNPDHHTWEFKLHQGVKLHDGTELTAADVVFSFDRSMNDNESRQAPTLRSIAGMEAPDPYTVRIRTKTPDAAFLDRLNNQIILSKAVFEQRGQEAADRQPIGSGPFKFKEWIPGQRLVLVKNPDYWGAFKSGWDEVLFRAIPEEEARITALLNGEVDVIANVSPQNVDRLNSSGHARAVVNRGDRLLFLGLNPIVEPLKSQKVRQAIAHAIDRDAIVQGILQGRAYRLDGPIGPGMYSYDPELKPTYPFNLERARQLLAEAGYPNGFEVEFYSPIDRYTRDKDIAAAIVNMLDKIGIKVTLRTQEWATFNDALGRGQLPMYLIGRTSVVDPSEYLHLYFRTGASRRLVGFSDPEVDAALLAEQQEFDPGKRLQLLRKAQSVIMEQSPVVFLLQYQNAFGASNRVDFEPRADDSIFAWDVKPRR